MKWEYLSQVHLNSSSSSFFSPLVFFFMLLPPCRWCLSLPCSVPSPPPSLILASLTLFTVHKVYPFFLIVSYLLSSSFPSPPPPLSHPLSPIPHLAHTHTTHYTHVLVTTPSTAHSAPCGCSIFCLSPPSTTTFTAPHEQPPVPPSSSRPPFCSQLHRRSR